MARRSAFVVALVALSAGSVIGCSGDSDGSAAGSSAVTTGSVGTDGASVPEADDDLQVLARQLREAVAAVDAELGGPQSYFEVTATPQLTNVFVVTDDAAGAIPYVFLDGALQPPGPMLSGTGNEFTAEALTFDESLLLGRIADELPSAVIESVSVEGGASGAVRYVVTARSDEGGLLEIVVGPDGAILSVEPV
jgi:hypothetical protein